MAIKKRFFLINIFFAIIAFFYGRVVAIRNKLYDLGVFKSYQFKTHIIVIGNLSVGGTGKTPHIEYLIRLLSDEFNINVLSRGYKRQFTGYIEAEPHHTVAVLGDEPRQIFLKFPYINLVVDEKRVRAITNIEKKTIDNDKQPVILMDDAFQHRSVLGGLNILLIDINNLPENDYYLPLGTLRDNKKQIKRANIIIFTKVEEDLKPIEKRILKNNLNLSAYQKVYFTKIIYKALIPLFSRKEVFDIKQLDVNFSVLLITGIERPETIYNFLNNKNIQIIHMRYNDHHIYSQTDISDIIFNFGQIMAAKKLIITTEKDAVRLKDSNFAEQIQHLPIYYLPIEIDFLSKEEKDKFNEQILKYVRENRSIS